MKFYIKQRVFSFGDRFTIYDREGYEKYYVEGEVFSFGKKLHLYDMRDREVCYIEQKLFAFRPRYSIYRKGVEVAQVVKRFAFFESVYEVEGLDWAVHGDFFDHTYEVFDGDNVVASVKKEWFTFGDAYEIDVSPTTDTEIALAVVLVIDACVEAQNN